MALWAKYSLLIDWNGSGLFQAWSRTGGVATQFGTGSTTAYFVVADGDQTDIPVGTKGQWVDVNENLLSEEVFTVTAISAPAFGFRNISVSPALPGIPQNGSKFWAVVATGVDVSAKQLAAAGISWSYGRDQARSTGRTKPGEAAFSLDNGDGTFSPENPGSALAGNLIQARPVMIKASFQGTVYTCFRGDTDDFTPVYGRASSVDVTCVDRIARLSGLKVSSALYQGIRTGDAINIILDAAGWTGGRDIDVGATQLPWFWVDGDDALEALRALIDGEGMPAFFGQDESGNAVFRDRHHRMIRSGSRTVQATWRDIGADPRFSLPLTYEHGARDVINSVDWEVGIRRPEALAQVWSQDSPVSLQDGETVKITAKANEPFFGMRTPTTGYDPDDDTQTGPDIDIKSGTINASIDRDSGQSVTLTITAVGGAAIIDRLSLRAQSVPVVYTVKVTESDGSSVTKYGQRFPDGMDPARWASVWDVASIAEILMAYRAERLPVISVTFKSGTPAILVEQLTRNLSDRVRVIYGEADLDREFFVETAKHTVRGRGQDRIHETTFQAEAAPDTSAVSPFILGSSNLGGTDVLSSGAMVDPNAVMILGTTNLGSGVLAP